MSHLTNGQQKLLMRLTIYPRIAWMAMLTWAINAVFFLGSAAYADEKFGHFYSNTLVLISVLMGLVLFIAGLYTFVYYRIKKHSTEYREIKRIAQIEANNNLIAAAAVTEDTPDGYCACFGIVNDRAKERVLAWLILPLVIMFSLHAINLFEGAREYKEGCAKVTETQQSIIAAFGDEYEVDTMTDPYTDYDYYSFYVEMCKKDAPNGKIEFTVRKNGEIAYQDYEYEFDSELSTNENLEKAMEFFEEIETIVPTLQDRFEEPRAAEFKYEMTSKFKAEIYSSLAKGSTDSIHHDSQKGHYNVYENCSFYRNPVIRINVYYYN